MADSQKRQKFSPQWQTCTFDPPKIVFPLQLINCIVYSWKVHHRDITYNDFQNSDSLRFCAAPSRSWIFSKMSQLQEVKTPCGTIYFFLKIRSLVDFSTLFNILLVPTPLFSSFMVNERLKVDVLHTLTNDAKVQNSATLKIIFHLGEYIGHKIAVFGLF